MKTKRYTVDELTRLAFFYAEQDRDSFASCCEEGTPEYELAKNDAAQLRKYRLKRWGKTRFDVVSETLSQNRLEKLLSDNKHPKS